MTLINTTPPRIRWLVKEDLPSVLNIESLTFEFPWTRRDFLRALRNVNTSGFVVEAQGQIVGYVIYEIHLSRLHILNVAIAYEHRGKGLGRSLIEKLTSKLTENRRDRILLEVRETNLAAQLFFRRLGFRAVRILEDFYCDEDECDESAYQLEYRYQAPVGPVGLSPANRIAGLMR